jgi:hypothetical protein
VRRLGLLLLVGCSSPSISVLPDSATQFEYTATSHWSARATPQVTSVTVDGAALASDATYTVHEVYASYADALASRASHPVVVTTSSETLTFELQMLDWPCRDWMTDAPVTKQEDNFSVGTGLDGRLAFDAYDGSCENGAGRVIQWTTRLAHPVP